MTPLNKILGAATAIKYICMFMSCNFCLKASNYELAYAQNLKSEPEKLDRLIKL